MAMFFLAGGYFLFFTLTSIIILCVLSLNLSSGIGSLLWLICTTVIGYLLVRRWQEVKMNNKTPELTENVNDRKKSSPPNIWGTITLFLFVCIIFITFGWLFKETLEKNVIGLFGIITISGAIGGIVTSLDSSKTHDFTIPFSGHYLQSGFIGHSFIGVCGSYVGVGTAILLTPFDVSVFLSDNAEVTKVELIEPLLITIAIGIVGGFSGLAIISKLSNHAIKKIETTMNEHDTKIKKQEEEIKKQKSDIYEEKEKNLSQQKEIERSKEDVEYSLAMIHIKNNDYQDALSSLEKIEQSDKYSKSSKYWINKGFVNKRLGIYADALHCANKALNLEPNNLYALYNKACYIWLSTNNEKEVIIILKQILASKNESSFSRIKEGFKKDEDLESFKTTESFSEIKSEFV